jgi:hypothetical protein
MKLITDTIKVNGKYSQKRILTYISTAVAITYAFIPIFVKEFDVKEFVFLGFLGMGSFSLFRTQKPNENIKTE